MKVAKKDLKSAYPKENNLYNYIWGILVISQGQVETDVVRDRCVVHLNIMLYVTYTPINNKIFTKK